MNIYVASSWRNHIQPTIVEVLRGVGHEVYDFKNPAPGDNGFGWSEIDPAWQTWNAVAFREALKRGPARRGFKLDMDALRACDACVLVLPCGRSAHLELGWAAGAGKKTLALVLDEVGPHEPELMYKMLDAPVCASIHEMIDTLARWGTERVIAGSVGAPL